MRKPTSQARSVAKVSEIKAKIQEAKKYAWRALFAAIVALGFTLLFNGASNAQDATAGGFDPDALEILQAERGFDDQIRSAEQELAQNRLAKAQCANSEAAQLASIKGGEAEAKANALGGVASKTIEGLAGSAFGSSKAEGKKASRDLAVAQGEAQDIIAEWPGSKTTNGLVDVASLQAAGNSTCSKLPMTVETTSTAPTGFLGTGGGKTTNQIANTDRTTCFTNLRASISEARSINSRINTARADSAAAGEIDLTAPAVGALVGVAGAGFQLHAANQGSKAQRKGAALTREMCDQQANLAIQNATRGLETLKIRRDQDLMNLKLQQAARKALAKENVPTVDTTLSNAGAAVAFPNGSLKGKGLALNTNPSGGAGAPPTGGGGGGGGGGAGGDKAPWTFGNGQEDFSGGMGLPNQPSAAQFQGEGGGGGGGGGGSGFGFEEGFDQGAAPGEVLAEGEGEGEGGELVLGDGGLNVMMSRARRRYGAHAQDLVRSLDLKELARKGPTPGGRVPAATSFKNKL